MLLSPNGEESALKLKHSVPMLNSAHVPSLNRWVASPTKGPWVRNASRVVTLSRKGLRLGTSKATASISSFTSRRQRLVAASVEGHAKTLTFKGLAMAWVECEPVVHKNEENTPSALQHMFGPKETIGFVHSDG